MPDCEEFGDTKECNTLRNVCAFNNGLDVPVLEAMGLGNIQDFKGIKKTATPIAQYGTLQENQKERIQQPDTGRLQDLFQKNLFQLSRMDSLRNLLTNLYKKQAVRVF